MRILLIFIDGLGLGPINPDINPIYRAKTPILRNIFAGKDGLLIKTDTILGVDGIPQSATGQTTLLTGINAPQIMGRHVSGFPGPILQKIISVNNIFIKLIKIGKKCTFANAYTKDYLHNLKTNNKIRASVTTFSTYSAKLPFRKVEQIVNRKAIYQDFSNKLLIERGFKIPEFTPERAAQNLINIFRENDFTLYEYFQTDRIGHSQDFNKAQKLLEDLDRFFKVILSNFQFENELIIITSDHGNIEDLTIKTHTTNPVPTIIFGKASTSLKHMIKDLTDITPAILSLFRK